MNIKTSRPSFVILTLPLLVYGQVLITEFGRPIDGATYTLACFVTSFTGTATWAKDEDTLTICTATFCSVNSQGVFNFVSNTSGILVIMDPVSSSVDGLWKCTASGNNQEIDVISTRSACSKRRRSATNRRKCANPGNKSQAAVNRVQPYILGSLVAIAVYITTGTISGLLCGCSIALLSTCARLLESSTLPTKVYNTSDRKRCSDKHDKCFDDLEKSNLRQLLSIGQTTASTSPLSQMPQNTQQEKRSIQLEYVYDSTFMKRERQ